LNMIVKVKHFEISKFYRNMNLTIFLHLNYI
jgi:hypothetical protein